MDGNRTFAKSRLLPTVYGHTKGMENLVEILEEATKLGVKTLTVYALSTENYLKREKGEVDHILKLIIKGARYYKRKLIGNNVRVKVLGKFQSLPAKIVQTLDNLVDQTKSGNQILLQICLNYGGRDEIIRSINKAIASGEKEITEEILSNYLDSSLEPDLIIRSGGFQRTSNFLPWQSVYSEYYFTDKTWPEFTKSDLKNAIDSFNQLKRKFGK
jgi:undecaprenyl diphosphate synthase